MTTKLSMAALGLVILLAAGCKPKPDVSMAQAKILNVHGDHIGSTRLEETDAGVRLHLTASYLEPGIHGFHIHEGGFCAPPKFETAEGHFNPDGKAHGFEADGGPHAGDIRNLEIDDQGNVELDRTISGLYLHAGERSIMGKTIVIHADPDDYHTQPSGNSGDGIACGVIQPGIEGYAPFSG
jgi:Cu-Zn family superoxide dismutase